MILSIMFVGLLDNKDMRKRKTQTPTLHQQHSFTDFNQRSAQHAAPWRSQNKRNPKILWKFLFLVGNKQPWARTFPVVRLSRQNFGRSFQPPWITRCLTTPTSAGGTFARSLQGPNLVDTGCLWFPTPSANRGERETELDLVDARPFSADQHGR